VIRDRITAHAVLAAAVCLQSVACSADSRGSTFGSSTHSSTAGGPGGGDPSGTGGATGSSGATGTGPIIKVDASMGTGGAGGGSFDPDAACAVGSASATLSPVNMLVTFDKSGSMSMNNKWTDATTAFIAFFRDPGTAGLRVAFRFFPDNLPAAGCDDQGCSIDACSQPLVPIAPLAADPAPQDAQEGALVTALMTAMPGGRGGGGGGGTPLFAALGGAEKWAVAYQIAHPDEKTVVILMTDGEPNGCDENIANIAAEAAAALQSNNILTYAIGLEGSNQMQMDQIAQAGGTMNAYFIGAGSMAQSQLLMALTAIRGRSLSCDFPVPAPKPGEKLDPTRVNVTFTPGGGAGMTLGQVPGAASCATSDAWYYDDPANPSRIFLCPSACDMVRADTTAKLEILLGCKTEIVPPR
jgi:Mg-chelatase subunit ChlD